MTPEDLTKYQFSYVDKAFTLLLMTEPTLQTIEEVRKLLAFITDSIIQTKLGESS
jgi:hypothetical protein